VDIEEFYEADERRRRSAEVELGSEWHDASGARYEVSWVADTGELYVMLEPVSGNFEDPFGDIFPSRPSLELLTVAVVGWIPDRERLDAVLAGWEDAMPASDSVSWLAARLRDEGVPRAAPAS